MPAFLSKRGLCTCVCVHVCFQAEGGPGADGPWSCRLAGTQKKPGAGCCHVGCCLHWWDQVGVNRLKEWNNMKYEWIIKSLTLVVARCDWQTLLSLLKASVGHWGWVQWVSGGVSAQWSTWLAGMYLQQEDGRGQASSWGEATIQEHCPCSASWHICREVKKKKKWNKSPDNYIYFKILDLTSVEFKQGTKSTFVSKLWYLGLVW